MTLNDLNMNPLEAILVWCGEAAPNPWYPSLFAQTSGIPRDKLDPYLDELRLGGLIHLTDWVQGRGQGYALTPAGADVLQNPRSLARLRANGVPQLPVVNRPLPVREPDTAVWDHGERVRSALLSPKTPVVTLGLIFANLLVFFYGYYVASQEGVPAGDYFEGRATLDVVRVQHQTGAIERWDVYPRGQWWRLLTCCFVHIGWIHLAVNMFSLYMVGPLLERMWGSFQYLLLYLLAGFCGSCAVVAFGWNSPATIAAGASGALWGVLASMLAWVLLNRKALPRALASTWIRQLLIVIILNVFITQSVPNISAEAHYGGGLFGLAAAVPLNYLGWVRGPRRMLAALGLLAVPFVAIGLVIWSFQTHREWELEEALNKYLVAVRDVALSSDKVFRDDVRPLLDERADERRADVENVKKAEKSVAAERAELARVADLLAGARIYQDDTLNGAMKAAKVYIKTLDEFFDHFEKSLTQKNWTDDDEVRLRGLRIRVADRRSGINIATLPLAMRYKKTAPLPRAWIEFLTKEEHPWLLR
jgi:membrane associated rhomboid family serine protease